MSETQKGEHLNPLGDKSAYHSATLRRSDSSIPHQWRIQAENGGQTKAPCNSEQCISLLLDSSVCAEIRFGMKPLGCDSMDTCHNSRLHLIQTGQP